MHAQVLGGTDQTGIDSFDLDKTKLLGQYGHYTTGIYRKISRNIFSDH